MSPDARRAISTPPILPDMIWPETGLSTTIRLPERRRDALSEDAQIDL